MGHGRARDQCAPNVYLVYTLRFSLTSMRPSTEWWASCLSSTNDCLNGSGSHSPFIKVNLFRSSAPALFAKPLHYATLFLPCCAHTDHSCLSTVKGSIYTYIYIYISLTSSPSFHWMSPPIYLSILYNVYDALSRYSVSLSLSLVPSISLPRAVTLPHTLSLITHSLTHSLIVGTQRRLRKRTAINGRWHLFVENLPKASLCPAIKELFHMLRMKWMHLTHYNIILVYIFFFFFYNCGGHFLF